MQKSLFLALFLLCSGVLSQGPKCNSKFLAGYGFDGYRTATPEQMLLCNNVPFTCCTKNDELKYQRKWNQYYLKKHTKLFTLFTQQLEKLDGLTSFLTTFKVSDNPTLFRPANVRTAKQLMKAIKSVGFAQFSSVKKDLAAAQQQDLNRKQSLVCAVCDVRTHAKVTNLDSKLYLSRNYCKALVSDFSVYVQTKAQKMDVILALFDQLTALIDSKHPLLAPNFEVIENIRQFQDATASCYSNAEFSLSLCQRFCSYYSVDSISKSFFGDFKYYTTQLRKLGLVKGLIKAQQALQVSIKAAQAANANATATNATAPKTSKARQLYLLGHSTTSKLYSENPRWKQDYHRRLQYKERILESKTHKKVMLQRLRKIDKNLRNYKQFVRKMKKKNRKMINKIVRINKKISKKLKKEQTPFGQPSAPAVNPLVGLYGGQNPLSLAPPIVPASPIVSPQSFYPPQQFFGNNFRIGKSGRGSAIARRIKAMGGVRDRWLADGKGWRRRLQKKGGSSGKGKSSSGKSSGKSSSSSGKSSGKSSGSSGKSSSSSGKSSSSSGKSSSSSGKSSSSSGKSSGKSSSSSGKSSSSSGKSSGKSSSSSGKSSSSSGKSSGSSSSSNLQSNQSSGSSSQQSAAQGNTQNSGQSTSQTTGQTSNQANTQKSGQSNAQSNTQSGSRSGAQGVSSTSSQSSGSSGNQTRPASNTTSTNTTNSTNKTNTTNKTNKTATPQLKLTESDFQSVASFSNATKLNATLLQTFLSKQFSLQLAANYYFSPNTELSRVTLEDGNEFFEGSPLKDHRLGFLPTGSDFNYTTTGFLTATREMLLNETQRLQALPKIDYTLPVSNLTTPQIMQQLNVIGLNDYYAFIADCELVVGELFQNREIGTAEQAYYARTALGPILEAFTAAASNTTANATVTPAKAGNSTAKATGKRKLYNTRKFIKRVKV